MSTYHLGALLIAAGLVLGCGISKACTTDQMTHVVQLATVIVGGVFGNATTSRARKRKRIAKKTPEQS